ncbi:MAG TPA: RNA polymerase sigma factor [Vicinamibacterales bacterium]|nr:RNA polymerase sigma factor [Vicinamibacterales bacterium]
MALSATAELWGRQPPRVSCAGSPTALRSADLARQERFDFDAEYVRRLTQGEPEIEEHFVRYFGVLLTGKLRLRLRSPGLVEDAKQETFMRVFATLRQKGGLATPEGLGAFVNSVANNVLFETYRTQSRHAPIADDDADEAEEPQASAESQLMQQEQASHVQQMLSKLPRREQDLLKGIFLEDRDKDEVCKRLNVDRAYLRVLLHRAKNHFRTMLEEEGIEHV